MARSPLCKKSGAPGRTRTTGTRFRKPLLYPPELRARFAKTRMSGFAVQLPEISRRRTSPIGCQRYLLYHQIKYMQYLAGGISLQYDSSLPYRRRGTVRLPIGINVMDGDGPSLAYASCNASSRSLAGVKRSSLLSSGAMPETRINSAFFISRVTA